MTGETKSKSDEFFESLWVDNEFRDYVANNNIPLEFIFGLIDRFLELTNKENAELKEQAKSSRMEKGVLVAKLKSYEALWDEQQRAIKEKSAQIEKMKSFIHSEIDFCMYCPLTKECINEEGTCPYAYATEEEQKNILMDFIKNGSWQNENERSH